MYFHTKIIIKSHKYLIKQNLIKRKSLEISFIFGEGSNRTRRIIGEDLEIRVSLSNKPNRILGFDFWA